MIISGKLIQQKILDELKKITLELSKRNITPGLGGILVGDDPASKIYVKNKEIACNILGVHFELIELKKDAKLFEIIDAVKYLNNNKAIDGILCQLPLPRTNDEIEVLKHIDPTKDVDCYHPYNQGLFTMGTPMFFPVTPYAVYSILKYSNIDVSGKEVVILGRSSTVGRPLSILMSKKGYDATVTLIHSKSKKIKEICRRGDILVSAIGTPKIVNEEFVKNGAVVIDVGINRIKDVNHPKGERVVGDVDFDRVEKIASYITPVPGGVGPVTIAILMKNTINAALAHYDQEILE